MIFDSLRKFNNGIFAVFEKNRKFSFGFSRFDSIFRCWRFGMPQSILKYWEADTCSRRRTIEFKCHFDNWEFLFSHFSCPAFAWRQFYILFFFPTERSIRCFVSFFSINTRHSKYQRQAFLRFWDDAKKTRKLNRNPNTVRCDIEYMSQSRNSSTTHVNGKYNWIAQDEVSCAQRTKLRRVKRAFFDLFRCTKPAKINKYREWNENDDEDR